MLKLTKRADYGMMAMRYLAEHADEETTHSARDIADAYNIPLPVLARTLQALAKAELTVSHAGSGGYTLARPSKHINTFEVICALDGPLFITNCTTVHGSCEMVGRCKVQEPLRRVNESIKTLLSNITVADLTDAALSSRTPTAERLVSIRY